MKGLIFYNVWLPTKHIAEEYRYTLFDLTLEGAEYSLICMKLIALGINHNTASLDVREKVAISPPQIEPALQDAMGKSIASELAILSTCNRLEIYCQCLCDPQEVLHWFAAYKGVEASALQDALYIYQGAEAARHMMSVASGLDSLVLGEPQILGQMKSCYAVAKEAGVLGSLLHDLFQRVFSVSKRVRSETAIGQHPVSVAYAAVSLAQQIFSDLKQDTALLIGAGETVELVARHLADKGIKQIIVANRTLTNAINLAKEFGGEAIILADIPEHLHRADIVISSTASQLPLLGKGAVEQALKTRKHKPMFMVDIAVPRDIEPQVGDLSDIYLYTVDDLREVIDENKRSREQAAKIAHDIVAEGVLLYERDLRSLSVVDTVKLFRQGVDRLREQELEKSLKSLGTGMDPKKVVEQLARSLTNKFMHGPTAQVKKASSEGQQDVIKGFQTIFELPGVKSSVIEETKSEKE